MNIDISMLITPRRWDMRPIFGRLLYKKLEAAHLNPPINKTCLVAPMELCKGFLQDGNIDFPVCAPESAWEHPPATGRSEKVRKSHNEEIRVPGLLKKRRKNPRNAKG